MSDEQGRPGDEPPLLSEVDRIAALPCWRGRVEIAPLTGGMTNRNYLVNDSGRRFVVRLGEDIPLHGVMRFNELAASRAAHEAGLSPAVIHAEPGMAVLDFVEGRALTPEDVRDPGRFAPIVDLIRRCHRDLPRFLRGPVLSFNIFHVLCDYLATLRDGNSPHAADTASWADRVALLNRWWPIDLVFGHNDLLAANLIDDGRRVADRLGLCRLRLVAVRSRRAGVNNGFDAAHERALLERYFGRADGVL